MNSQMVCPKCGDGGRIAENDFQWIRFPVKAWMDGEPEEFDPPSTVSVVRSTIFSLDGIHRYTCLACKHDFDRPVTEEEFAKEMENKS